MIIHLPKESYRNTKNNLHSAAHSNFEFGSETVGRFAGGYGGGLPPPCPPLGDIGGR